jgi:hypothetical protein
MLEDGDTIQGILVPVGQRLKMPNRLPNVLQPRRSACLSPCVKKHIGDGLGCGTLVW